MFTALMAGLAAGAVAAIGSTISSVSSSKSQEKINAQNEQRVKSENEITREREDTAVQRRVADLRLAGLSPTLAAGSAASSSAGQIYQQTNNPAGDVANAIGQAPSTMLNAVQTAANISGQMQSISQSKSQQALLDAQVTAQRQDNALQALYGAEQLKDKHLLSQAQYDNIVSSTRGNVLNNAIIEKYGMTSAKYDLLNKENSLALNQENLQNLRYDSNYWKSRGYTSRGPLSTAGRMGYDSAIGLNGIFNTVKGWF